MERTRQMERSRVSLANGTSKGVVLDLIRTRGPVSRTDLARLTGLTGATMTTVVRQLLDEGLIRETGLGVPKGGRPVVLLELDTSARFAVGVQFGAESITYVVVNLRGGIVGRVRTAGAGGTEPATVVARLVGQITTMLAALGIDTDRVVGIGLAAPGPVDVAAGVVLGPPQMASWHNVPLRTMLAESTHLPVLFDNDATAAALGDFWSGETAPATAHATIYMGMGIGAGILIDGMIYRGASSNTGELGQMLIGVTGDGELATVQDLAGPASVVRAAHREPEHVQRLALAGSDFAQFTALAKASARGDEFATGLIEGSARYLAAATTTMANLFDLDSISLAGPAFGVAGPTYLRVIDAFMRERFFARSRHGVRVRLSVHVPDAAAVGAAVLVLQSELAPRTMGLTIPLD